MRLKSICMVSRCNGSPSLMEYVRALENRLSRDRGERVLAILAALGIEPAIQECRRPRLRNIIVDFSSDPEARRLLFSAHYDVVKDSPGANDNASGVAVLLGLCAHLRHVSAPVRVIFFDREEAWLRTPILGLGSLGSLYYVWKANLRNIAAVYNLELCGLGDFLGIWPISGKQSDLPAIRQVTRAASGLGLPFKSADVPWLLLSSDHSSFRLRGISNALTLSLLPADKVPELEALLTKLTLLRLLSGRRAVLLPEPLNLIHNQQDDSSHLNEGSLKLMLSLLLELIQSYDLSGGSLH